MNSLRSFTAAMLAPFSSCAGQTTAATQANTAQAPETGSRHRRKQEKKQQKIAAFFNRLEDAGNKRGDPTKMRNFILKRQQLDQTKRELADALEANPKDKALIKRLQEEVKSQKAEVQTSYIEGPQGMSLAQLKEKRREQWKAASIEGLHTMFGARLFSAASGIGGVELSSVGSKAALHQGLGYGPQSLASGLFRIVTEVPQIRMNKGGKPKLPSNLAATSNFKQNCREMKTARSTLQTATQSLRSAYDAAARDASDANLETLTRELENLMQAVRHLAKFDSMYENLCIQLEREFRGKKASAVVSVLAGVMSGGALAIDQSGVAAIVGHKLLCLGGLLLQGPMSPFDYMDGNVDYPQKMSAKKIDLSLLIKPESRNKEVDALDDDDFDTAIAAKLYDEQPQLMQGVIRSVYTHKMAELNAKLSKLEREIETGDARPFLQGSVVYSASALAALQREEIRKKKQTLEQTRHDFEELKNQIVLFEQHQRDRIDPDGLIGKAITDPVFFCRKGISAGVFNKVGEFWSQANQRISNNFNPMASLGLVALALDGVSIGMGSHLVHDGIHSFEGNGPHNAAAEGATAGMLTATGVAALNSGVTVGPARFNKTIYDRKTLAPPAYISKGKGIDSEEARTQLEEALRNGIISKRKKRKLEKALSIIETSQDPDAQQPAADKAARAQRKWEKFDALKLHVNEMVKDINEKWLIHARDAEGNPLRGCDGKPIVIDLRSTAACHRQYMPALERVLVPLKGIPRSIKRAMTFWRDVIRAKNEREKCRKMVDGERFADPELGNLISNAERLLRPAEALSIQSESVIDHSESRDTALSEMVPPEHWATAETGPSRADEQENLRDELDKAKAELQRLKQDNAALKFVSALRKQQVETRNTEIASLKKPVQKQRTTQKQPQKTEVKPHEFPQSLRRYPQTGPGSGTKKPWR